MRNKKIFFLFISGLIISLFSIGVSAYGQVPEYVRVGLYFNGSGAENKAAPSYQVYSASGVSVGYTDGGDGCVHLYDFKVPSEGAQMVISKCSFASKYAVVTGKESGNLFEVAGRVDALKKKGFDPYLVYFNGWALVTGVYNSAESAAQDIDAVFKQAFPNYGFTAEPLSGKYILISIGGARQFIFDADSNNLRIWPSVTDAQGDGAAQNGDAVIGLNGGKYRGTLEFIRGSDGALSVVNRLKMNEYLYGVVPKEIQASSSQEALKAQAITARTYALNTMNKHGSGGFGLCSTAHCQVYGGYDAEDSRSTRAVDETGDKIVTYKGSPAQVYYFSSSGGHTANVKYVWSGSEYPYLSGVEDNYESGQSYNYNWEKSYTADEIKAALAKNGINIGDIVDVAVTTKAEGGYVTGVQITGTDGTKVYTNGSCRTFLGGLNSQVYSIYANGSPAYAAIGADGVNPVLLESFEAVGAGGKTATVTGDGVKAVSGDGVKSLTPRGTGTGTGYTFIGKGWGHGVGMSQEGARGMANAGFSCVEILTHYFPGCEVG